MTLILLATCWKSPICTGGFGGGGGGGDRPYPYWLPQKMASCSPAKLMQKIIAWCCNKQVTYYSFKWTSNHWNEEWNRKTVQSFTDGDCPSPMLCHLADYWGLGADTCPTDCNINTHWMRHGFHTYPCPFSSFQVGQRMHGFLKFSRGDTLSPPHGRGRPPPEPTPADDLRRERLRPSSGHCAADCWDRDIARVPPPFLRS